MIQVQHVINLMLLGGLVIGILLITYAGFLFIKGSPADRTKAKEIFPKLVTGFIIMLSAWVIVFQILTWLSGNSGFATLLGG